MKIHKKNKYNGNTEKTLVQLYKNILKIHYFLKTENLIFGIQNNLYLL